MARFGSRTARRGQPQSDLATSATTSVGVGTGGVASAIIRFVSASRSVAWSVSTSSGPVLCWQPTLLGSVSAALRRWPAVRRRRRRAGLVDLPRLDGGRQLGIRRRPGGFGMSGCLIGRIDGVAPSSAASSAPWRRLRRDRSAWFASTRLASELAPLFARVMAASAPRAPRAHSLPRGRRGRGRLSSVRAGVSGVSRSLRRIVGPLLDCATRLAAWTAVPTRSAGHGRRGGRRPPDVPVLRWHARHQRAWCAAGPCRALGCRAARNRRSRGLGRPIPPPVAARPPV